MQKQRNISSFFSHRLLDEPKAEAAKRGLPLRLMFQDEAGFGRISEPYACWAPAGFRPDVPAQIIREYTYLYGTVSPQDGKADFLVLPAMDGTCMSVFLAELSQRYATNIWQFFGMEHPVISRDPSLFPTISGWKNSRPNARI